MTLVIIGGVAGGASAAARARRVNAQTRIIILEKGPNVSFANCGLPYHIGGEIEQRGKLIVTKPELLERRFGIEVRTMTEAIEIDRSGKRVRTRDGAGKLAWIEYDSLILSPGAAPIVPEFAAGTWSNVATLWSLDDMDRIIASISGRKHPSAVVIGGGFVGLEVAEQLVVAGASVTLIERNPQVLKTLDPEMARMVAEELMNNGIDLQLSQTVCRLESIQENGSRRATGVTVGGLGVDETTETIPADVIVLALGIRPRTELALQAGLAIGPQGGISVNGQMQTSDPNIYAVGDCTEVPHAVLGRPQRVPLAGPANRAGRIAGEAAVGGSPRPMRPVLGTSVLRVFSKAAASTGLTQSQCNVAGIENRAVFIQASDHASYFPGAQTLTLKLVYRPSGEILGAQCVGGAGVDKRIDVISTVLSMGGTVWDLAGLDLAYAPPYGSAKDPIHMAAFVACNDLESAPGVLPPDADLEGFQVVDVRSSTEQESLPLPGAIAIPIDELKDRMCELDPELPTIAVCHSGKRGHVAACWMSRSGFSNVRNLTGGMVMRTLSAAAAKR